MTRVLICRPGWPGTYPAGLSLPLPPVYEDYGCEPPHLAISLFLPRTLSGIPVPDRTGAGVCLIGLPLGDMG